MHGATDNHRYTNSLLYLLIMFRMQLRIAPLCVTNYASY